VIEALGRVPRVKLCIRAFEFKVTNRAVGLDPEELEPGYGKLDSFEPIQGVPPLLRSAWWA
jgi:hypothetical protein